MDPSFTFIFHRKLLTLVNLVKSLYGSFSMSKGFNVNFNFPGENKELNKIHLN